MSKGMLAFYRWSLLDPVAVDSFNTRSIHRQAKGYPLV